MRYQSLFGFAAALTLVCSFATEGFTKNDDKACPTTKANSKQGKLITTSSGLKYQDITVGKGASPKNGQNVSVHYTGWLTNGTKFDSSVDRGTPFQFVLGQGNVIKGWDEGVLTMKIGGKRKLIIPAKLGYGDAGTPGGPIPPNATLMFDVELLGVQ